MSISACAEIVQKGDPDRFLAAMAAPVAARHILFPIYAFNVEVARAPWVTQEPMIAEMRLQWWWDALEEIATQGKVRAHEVTTPLAEALDAPGAEILKANVDARRRDARREDPGNLVDLRGYLQNTGGALMWATARALGSDQEPRARAVGGMHGLANYLLAVPHLRALGRQPWPETSSAAFREEISQTMGQVQAGRFLSKTRLSHPQRVAELAAWRARRVLRRAFVSPEAVGAGTLEESEARKRFSLFWAALGV